MASYALFGQYFSSVSVLTSFEGQRCTGGGPLTAARVDRRGDGGEGRLVNSTLRVLQNLKWAQESRLSLFYWAPYPTPTTSWSSYQSRRAYQSIVPWRQMVLDLWTQLICIGNICIVSSLSNNRDYLVSWCHLEKGDQIVCLLQWGDMLAGFTKRLGFLFL